MRTEEKRKKVAEKTGEMLDHLFEKSAKERAKAAARRVLRGEKENRDRIFWPAGLLLLGLAEAGISGDSAALEKAKAYLSDFFSSGGSVTHVDDAVACTAAVRIFEKTGEPAMKQAADAGYAALMRAPRDCEGAIIYNPARGNQYIFADGTGQSTLFLASYGRVFQEKKAVDEAARQMELFLKNGLDERTGLPYHGYDAKTHICQGIVGWGRAAGWLLPGAGELLLAGTETALRDQIISLFAAVRSYERKDHLFSWTLPGTRGPADTSATAMILYGAETARQAGCSVFSGEEITAAGEALLGLTLDDGTVTGASAECIDFGQYVQQYGNYPWGQGSVCAALWRRVTG